VWLEKTSPNECFVDGKGCWEKCVLTEGALGADIDAFNRSIEANRCTRSTTTTRKYAAVTTEDKLKKKQQQIRVFLLT
jgi:hypothetical protein